MYLYKKDNPTLWSGGYYGIKFQYDEFGRVISNTSIDKNGIPYVNRNGWVVKKYTYYCDNSIKSESYHDLEGNPVSLYRGQYGIFYTKDREQIYLNKNKHQLLLDELLSQNLILVPLCALLLAL